MSSITIDDGQLKALLKQALIELLEEKNELLYDVIAKVVEDIGLAKALREGEASPVVSREKVFEVLEREP